jgi:hypothetical protein
MTNAEIAAWLVGGALTIAALLAALQALVRWIERRGDE